MINQSQKLNPKIFSSDIERVPLRQGFGDGLLQAGEANEEVVALCADLTDSTKVGVFAKKFPQRFIQSGIGEQSMASVAAGFSAMGKVPFFASYAMFSPGRNWEQIRTTICYNDSNVKIIGAHAGVSVGPDGGTHQAIEDIAITRVIPRLTVVVPADSIEAKKATLEMAKTKGPVYLRLAREGSPVVTTEESPFEIGKANLLFNPQSPVVAIIVCGQLVHNAILAAKELESEGVAVSVLNNHTIKPIDKEAIISVAKQAGAVVTVEEHQVAGGMGSAVAEVLASNHPVPIEFIGVKDKFGQSGTPEELIEYYGMGVKGVVEAVKRVLGRT